MHGNYDQEFIDNWYSNLKDFSLILMKQIVTFCMQQHFFDDFGNEGHCSFLEDVTITFITKTDPIDPNPREHYRMHTL